MNKYATRLIAAFLVLMLTFTFAACNSSKSEDTTSGSTAGGIPQHTQSTTGTTVSTTAQPTESTTEPTEGTTAPTESNEVTNPIHEHTYSTQVIEPVGSAQGYTLYTCTACGHSYKDQFFWNNAPESDPSFFDDAAFIGDSVTLALRNYCATTKALGNATFLCVGSYSVNNAVTNGLYLTYQGQQMTPQDALAACGAKKVFIMLGMNDIALFGDKSIDKAMENWSIMLSSIRQKSPDIQIYIQSATPIYTAGQKGSLNNARMDQYNARLATFAQENGCIYVDIASYMKDDTNGLAARYCSDAYVHLTTEGVLQWIQVLKSSVA